MDDRALDQIFHIVKAGIPGTTIDQLEQFIKAQDQERKRWLDNANYMDAAYWVVATMKHQSSGVNHVI
jgi:hypothetical protein